jgi:hypothetical protein
VLQTLTLLAFKEIIMKSQYKKKERGIALVYCLFALMILTAITTSLILLSGTETSVNYNYRTEEISFFAAKAGIYEALDRMQQSNANSIAANLPTSIPSAAGGVLYLINSGSSLAVKPWDTTNTYADDELCHEGYAVSGMTSAPPDIPCTTAPSGTSWYTTVNSNYPWSGTSTAMPYEWVRMNWKQNSTQTYLTGGTPPTISYYSVNSAGLASTPVCWNGGSEVLLSTPAGVTPAYTSCEQYQTCGATSPSLSTPVLLITALAVTSNGSRQMVQAEAALNPPTVNISPCGISDPYGFFAYGNACVSGSGAPFDLGGNASVDGYNSAGGGTYATTHSNLLGSIGSNGSVYAHGTSTSIGGKVYVQNPGPAGGSHPYTGSCPTFDFSVSGNPTYGSVLPSTPLTAPTVTIPANSSTTDESAGHGANLVLVPGSYQNVSVSSGGTITLTAPGTYNIDCLTASSSGSNIAISPLGKAVTLNISGTGCVTAPISFGSNTFINNASGVAANFQINYPGTGTLTFTGGSSTYAIVNAPNAAVVLHGGSDFYGALMANTIDDSGGVNLHFDTADTTISGTAASTATATATGSYNTLAFRSLPY